MDDPRLVALGLVPPPPGQREAAEPMAPAQPQQSHYVPSPNPFSAAASAIPEYPDPFTSPPAASPQPPQSPPQPAVPSIFNSPNSPFSFAQPTPTPSAPAPSAPAPTPFTSPNSPFSVGRSAAPAVGLATREMTRKEAKHAAEEAKKAAKLAEEYSKEAAKLAAAQAKTAEREAKKRGAKSSTPEAQAPTAALAPAPKPFLPSIFAPPPAPPKTQAYVELMAAIGRHAGVIRKDVHVGIFGRARLELAPMGFALVGLRGGTAYTWSEVKEVQARRGQIVIKTEADREKVVKAKEGATSRRYVEKMTRALVVSIDGATEPGFAPFIARVMQDMRAQTFNYHATSWLEYENALERVKGDFAESDDPFVPAVAGALFGFIFLAGLFILPVIVNLVADIRPPAGSGAFVIQPRSSWLDVRSFVMAVGLSALLTRLVLRLGLGSTALSWARGTARGWHTGGPRAMGIASRMLARLLLGTSVAAGALFFGFAAFAPTVGSTLVIDGGGIRQVFPLPILGIDRQWSDVSEVQKTPAQGRLEGFGVTVIFGDGRSITSVDHYVAGGTDGQLLKSATSWWQNATR